MGKYNEVYTDRRFKIARVKALVRDEYKCQWCLEKGVTRAATIAHHIIHLTDDNYKDIKIAYNLKNLISVCDLCHKQHHNPTKDSSLRNIPFPIGVDSHEYNRELP